MIHVERYSGFLNNVANEYFIGKLKFVPDLSAWARSKGIDLSEPAQPMKLVREKDNTLTLVVQSWLNDETLDGVINALGVRWALRDTVTNLFDRLNSVKKKLGFCFLKEYARTRKEVKGSERVEDEWALNEMERFGCFRE